MPSCSANHKSAILNPLSDHQKVPYNVSKVPKEKCEVFGIENDAKLLDQSLILKSPSSQSDHQKVQSGRDSVLAKTIGTIATSPPIIKLVQLMQPPL